MKKNIILLAAAALTLGMTACTDDFNYNDIINEGTEIVDVPLVKSVEDLHGTSWSYAMDDIAIVDEMGDTLGLVPLSDLAFNLTFDGVTAQLQFPEDMVMLSLADDMTVAELNAMQFDYTYDAATTSGMLTATDNDITGETIDMQVPFTYDVATDAIIIDFNFAYEGAEDDAAAMQLVFHRN